ncbi:MAG: substrate-binding domain-containing protein, partial [Methylococcales bacterium]|nr:substrate-binding domain-containing protein [Methylococcales bacterium]
MFLFKEKSKQMLAGTDLRKDHPAKCQAEKNWVPFVFATLVFALAFGCGKKPKQTSIRLYAGAGMRHAVEALSMAFEQQSGIAVEADYAGSGTLVTRAMGDPSADLFMPGDVWYVDRLHEKTGNIEEKLTVSYFVPTLIVAKGNPFGIRCVGDLE